MSFRSSRDRLADILEAIAEIQAFTQALSYENCPAAAKTLKAVFLDFVIIGEAAAHLPEKMVNDHPETYPGA